jgi:hypothetical protein
LEIAFAMEWAVMRYRVITYATYREKHYSIGETDHAMLACSMDPNVVRDLIRQRILDGRLPRTPLIELGYGHGIRKICDGCGAIIEMNQTMTVRMSGDDWRTVRLHDDCFQIWDTEIHTNGQRV